MLFARGDLVSTRARAVQVPGAVTSTRLRQCTAPSDGRRRGWRGARFLLLATAFLLIGGCKRRTDEPEWQKDPPRPANLPPAVPERPAAQTSHPRLLLDQAMIERIKRHAKANSPLWKVVSAKCQVATGKVQQAEYQGHGWARAVAELTICWRATGDTRYADRAVLYLGALLDDEQIVGDGKGGNATIHRNRGYPIRAYGVFAALGYDWLYDAPSMTPQLRERIVERLKSWISWYRENGYLNDSATANYFWGYMTTLSLAGLALDGEDEIAQLWQAETKRLIDNKIIPVFWKQLKGGDWPEGLAVRPVRRVGSRDRHTRSLHGDRHRLRSIVSVVLRSDRQPVTPGTPRRQDGLRQWRHIGTPVGAAVAGSIWFVVGHGAIGSQAARARAIPCG